MTILMRGAREHNLKGIDVEIGEGLTVVTGVSGSGKTSLVFDTLYHEARRRFLDVFNLGTTAARLHPAEVDEITGLGPAVAVGQNLLNRNPASTLATACGLHPFLRLLYTHFADRACPACGTSLTIYSIDGVLEKIAQLSKQGSVELFAPLINQVRGSHRTLLAALRDEILPRSDADELALWVDGAPWQNLDLDACQRHSIHLRLAVFDGKHPFTLAAGRAALEQATAFGATAIQARFAGKTEVLSRAAVCINCGTPFVPLEPVHFNTACAQCNGEGCTGCAGSGLSPQAAAARWAGLRFNELLAFTVDEARKIVKREERTTPRLQTEITSRLDALQQVGLGYLTLNRPSPSLSRGESQRVRLAVALTSRLEDMLHVLDEPTVGLHPVDVQRLLPVFRRLGGPVVYVEHDRAAAAGADQAIDLGPGAGQDGGEIVFTGAPADLWRVNTPTGHYFSGRERVVRHKQHPAAGELLMVRRAALRNLQEIDVPIPIGRFVVISGPSGSGKSTLVEDVLVASLNEGKPIGCTSIDGPAMVPVLVDQSPIGRNPRSNPATYTKLADAIRDLFAAATGLSASHFSFNRPEGACPACSGLGAIEVTMRYLPSTWLTCQECGGERFTEEVLAAQIELAGRFLSIADFYRLSVSEALPLFSAQTYLANPLHLPALRILNALQEIGLGYLPLGQPSPSLSGGEAQRVKLARSLGQKSLAKRLLVLDEPSTGLHPQDLAGLLGVLERLVQAGATVLVVEHNTDVIRAADWVIDLGPGAGPGGGRLLYAGPPGGLKEVAGSPTGQALAAEERAWGVCPEARQAEKRSRSSAISIRGARVHNLQDVEIDFPKGALTVVTGVSGSGKSSLVHDILETEARRRYLESLSLYERQGTHEGPEADVETVAGLGVALPVGSERLVYSRRATVGTATGLSRSVAVLLAMVGERTCLVCGAKMIRWPEHWECSQCSTTVPADRPQHFESSTYASACLTCNGIGTLQVPQTAKLIVNPEKPLVEGAMYSPGFFPNGYLGKPYNHGYYMLMALAERYGFDPHLTPWNAMSAEAQQAFLFGTDEELLVQAESRTGRSVTRHLKFPGFYGFIRDWDVGGTYTDTVPCPSCGGTRLRPEYLAVRLGGWNAYQLGTMSLQQLAGVLEKVGTQDREVSTQAHRAALARLHFLQQVGLGYLNLDRVAGTLSAGEVQRIRLASLLGSGLTSLTLLLDEPTRGLHPVEVHNLLSALLKLRDEGNTVIVVEHDPLVIAAADTLVDMGPGAGRAGGKVVAQGPPEQVKEAHTLTGSWLRGEQVIERRPRRAPSGWMSISGARENNLANITVQIPLGLLVGVCGISGSGKSTLVIDTLGRALAPRKQTTSVAYEPVAPGAYDSIDGAPTRALIVDQARAGVINPASYLGLAASLRVLFAESEDAIARGLTAEQLGARCSTCSGSGVISLDMAFLPDVHLPCEICRGTGFQAEAWQAKIKGFALPEVFQLTIEQVFELFGEDERIRRPLLAALEVGLGYLVLRQPGYALSGGEAQRLKIAQELSRKGSPGTLYILDEPTVGQHLEDVRRLAGVLHRLVESGGSVIIIEHHPHLLSICDWLIELGPGGGPDGGRVIAQGTPEQLSSGSTPIAPFLAEVLQ